MRKVHAATLVALLAMAIAGWMAGLPPPLTPATAYDAIHAEGRGEQQVGIWVSEVEALNGSHQVSILGSKGDAGGSSWYGAEADDRLGQVYGDYVSPVLSSRSGRAQSIAAGASASTFPAVTSTLSASSSQPSSASGRVGLQVGHWRNWEASYPFNQQDGSSWNGHSEAEINLAIAEQTASYLRPRGYQVDLLPARMPSDYRADVVVAIHADGGPSSRRGFFADRPAEESAVTGQEDRLVRLLNDEYAKATGLLHVYRGTAGTLYYYAYYSVAQGVPIAIIETGFLTNAEDRGVIVSRPDLAGKGIGRAIELFLHGSNEPSRISVTSRGESPQDQGRNASAPQTAETPQLWRSASRGRPVAR